MEIDFDTDVDFSVSDTDFVEREEMWNGRSVCLSASTLSPKFCETDPETLIATSFFLYASCTIQLLRFSR